MIFYEKVSILITHKHLFYKHLHFITDMSYFFQYMSK